MSLSSKNADGGINQGGTTANNNSSSNSDRSIGVDKPSADPTDITAALNFDKSTLSDKDNRNGGNAARVDSASNKSQKQSSKDEGNNGTRSSEPNAHRLIEHPPHLTAPLFPEISESEGVVAGGGGGGSSTQNAEDDFQDIPSCVTTTQSSVAADTDQEDDDLQKTDHTFATAAAPAPASVTNSSKKTPESISSSRGASTPIPPPPPAPPVSTSASSSSSSSTEATDRPSFATALIRDWALAVQRVDKGRRLVESLYAQLKERVDLEETYAAGLERIASRFTCPPSECSGVESTVAAVRNESFRRSEQAYELAEAIRSDILEGTVSATVQNHAAVLKQISADGVEVSRVFRSAVDHLQSAEKRYALAGRQAYDLCCEVRMAERSLPSVRTRLSTKAMVAILELRSAEKDYRKRLSATAEIQSSYLNQMSLILNSLQDMDAKRLACFKDSLRKLMVYQASYLRNAQYDLDATIQAVENLNDKEEINEFVARYARPASAGQIQPPLLFSSEDLQPRHWSKLSPSHASISVPSEFNSLRDTSVTLSSLSQSGRSVVTATRSLLKNSPLDKVVRTATQAAGEFMGLDINIKESSIPVPTSTELSSTMTNKGASVGHARSSTNIVTGNMSSSPTSLSQLRALGDNTPTGQESAIAKIEGDYNALLEMIFSFEESKSREICKRVDRAKEDLSSSLHRGLLVQCLDKKRKEGFGLLPNMDALRALGVLVEFALDWADRQWDVVMGRGVVALCQKFYAMGDVVKDDPQLAGSGWVWPHIRQLGGDGTSPLASTEPPIDSDLVESPKQLFPWFLHRVVYHHVLWNRVPFWEEIFLLSTSEAMQRELLDDIWTVTKGGHSGKAEKSSSAPVPESKRIEGGGETKITDLPEGRLPTSPSSMTPPNIKRGEATSELLEAFLPNFALCMIAFGIVEAQVISLIDKICARHHLGKALVERQLECLQNEHRPQLKNNKQDMYLPLAPFTARAHPPAAALSSNISSSSAPAVKDPNQTGASGAKAVSHREVPQSGDPFNITADNSSNSGLQGGSSSTNSRGTAGGPPTAPPNDTELLTLKSGADVMQTDNTGDNIDDRNIDGYGLSRHSVFDD